MNSSLHPEAIVTNAQMAELDRATIQAGTPGSELMQRVGKVVAHTIMKRYEKQPVLVIAGPGNNGGDGFYIAEILLENEWDVSVAFLGEQGEREGESQQVAAAFHGKVLRLHPYVITEETGLVVDALFGTGLEGEITGEIAETLEKIARRRLPVVAVDIPSGINGDTGEVCGVAAPAELTVTIHRKKLGHVLAPGCGYCGEVTVADIGIVNDPLETPLENTPALWMEQLPCPDATSHKYTRGHALVQGGEVARAGAARLAARAALRAGAGLVTIICDKQSLPVYAAACEAVMTQVVEEDRTLVEVVTDSKVKAVLIGPGCGVGTATQRKTLMALKAKKPLVLDADGLSSFEGKLHVLRDAVKGTPCVLTPHEGEFERLFPNIAGNKLERAVAAAKESGAIVVLKGADTVIASPDGEVWINATASPYLATAGSGDVLAGIIAGLLAQGMPAHQAAGAAVWLHGRAGQTFGAGLIAEDLTYVLPKALKEAITSPSRRESS